MPDHERRLLSQAGRWVRNPLVLGAAIFVVALVLGYIGYRDENGPDLPPADALFRAMQLFALDEPLGSADFAWQLEVARFLAPVLVVGATSLAIAAVLRTQLERARVALFARDHIVILGLGEPGTGPGAAIAAALLAEQSRTVVVVETHESHPSLAGLRAAGARTIVGDPRLLETLHRAEVGFARHVIITTGQDDENLLVTDRVRDVVGDRTRRPLSIHLAIEDVGLWRELGQLTIGRKVSGVSIECFNLVDRAARAVVDHALATAGVERLSSVHVDGDGALRDCVLDHLHRYSLKTVRDRAGPAVPTSPDDDQQVVIVCSTLPDAGTMARAIAHARSSTTLTVHAVVTGDASLTVLGLSGTAGRLHLVSMTPLTLASEFLAGSGIEVLARARHRDYLLNEAAKGTTVVDNPSMVAWEDLPESLRESNRRFAESVGSILDEAGVRLVPATPQDGVETTWRLDGTLLEDLARREHDRWFADLVRQGWTYSAAPKDPVGLTHPLLVAWEDLDEAERQKDRDAVNAVPGMLAAAGFELRI